MTLGKDNVNIFKDTALNTIELFSLMQKHQIQNKNKQLTLFLQVIRQLC